MILPAGPGESFEPSGRPSIDGLRFRRWAGPADLEPIARVMNASWTADRDDELTSVAKLANDYANEEGFDVRTDLVLAALADDVVGVVTTSRRDHAGGERRYWVDLALAPEARGLGIEGALLAEAHRRAAERAAAEKAAGADGGPARRVTSIWISERAGWLVALLEAEGYQPRRWFFEMLRPTLDDLPERPLPPGLELRPVDESSMLAVLRASDEAFEDHWGHTPLNDADIEWVRNDPELDLSLWFAAWDGDEVAAVTIGKILHEENRRFGWRRAWIDDVATRRPWRRRGVASALMVAAMAELRARGMDSAGLGVDADNPTGALGIYERLGFVVDKRATIRSRPVEVA